MFPEVHNVLIYSFIIATISIALFKSFADSYLSKNADNYIDALQDFIRMNASIVATKDYRFKRAANRLNSEDDIFLQITHPVDQINTILVQARDFLINRYGLETEDNIRITIIDKKEGQEWDYAFDTHASWSQTPASELLSTSSAASDCLTTGEPRFHVDKEIANAEGLYALSERDQRFGNGSVYCYPVSVTSQSFSYTAIITFITYKGKKLSNGFNDRETERISTLLKEVCRRIELELTLGAIKGWALSQDGSNCHD